MAPDGVNAWSQTLDDGDLPGGGSDRALRGYRYVGEDVTTERRRHGRTVRQGGGPENGHDELDLAKLDSAGAPGGEGHGAGQGRGRGHAEACGRCRRPDRDREQANPFVKLSFSELSVKDEGAEIEIDGITSATVDKTKIVAKGTKVKFRLARIGNARSGYAGRRSGRCVADTHAGLQRVPGAVDRAGTLPSMN